MKQFAGIILSLILLLVCSACGNTGDDAAAPVPPAVSSPTPQPTASVEPTVEVPVKEEYIPKTFLSEETELTPDISCEVRVNPCVVLLVDSKADTKVCGVTFVNEDAAKILDAADFLGRTFGEAYAALLAAFVDNGYAKDSALEPEITFAGVTSADGEYVMVPVDDTGNADLPTIDDLHFYVDAINETLANALESGEIFDPAAAAAEADRAKAAASVERREYTYTVDPVPFDIKMYSWRFSMPLENAGDTAMKFCHYRCLKRLGGENGTIIYDRTWQPDEWCQRDRPLEWAPGENYTYNDGHPVEDRSFDYMGYFFTFVDETGKTIEIIYHFNLTFNLPPKD